MSSSDGHGNDSSTLETESSAVLQGCKLCVIMNGNVRFLNTTSVNSTGQARNTFSTTVHKRPEQKRYGTNKNQNLAGELITHIYILWSQKNSPSGTNSFPQKLKLGKIHSLSIQVFYFVLFFPLST